MCHNCPHNDSLWANTLCFEGFIILYWYRTLIWLFFALVDMCRRFLTCGAWFTLMFCIIIVLTLFWFQIKMWSVIKHWNNYLIFTSTLKIYVVKFAFIGFLTTTKSHVWHFDKKKPSRNANLWIWFWYPLVNNQANDKCFFYLN